MLDNSDLLEYNLYTYCLNNPINMADGNGNNAISSVLRGVGGGISGSLSGVVAPITAVVNVVVQVRVAQAQLRRAQGIYAAKRPIPPSKLKYGNKVKTPDSHPDEFTKDNGSDTYTHNKTGWKAKRHKGQRPHGGPHWDMYPPIGTGHINVGLDGNVFGGSMK